MHVLVTGATGFVGSHCAQAVIAAGHEVSVSVRAGSDQRWLTELPVRRVTLDLSSPVALEAALEGVEVVVHAAGVTRARHASEYERVNADGAGAMLRAAVAAGAARFVLVSSLAARGPDEEGVALSAYGQSKRDAERLAASFGDRLEVSVLAVGGVYGPRDTDLLPVFRMAQRGLLVLPPRRARLQPVYATDVAEAIAVAASRPVGFGPWPVAGAHVHSWSEFAGYMEGALGHPLRALHLPAVAFAALALGSEATDRLRRRAPTFDLRRARDVAAHTYTCDIGPTVEATGWRPRVGLAEGLARTAAWYRERGWLA